MIQNEQQLSFSGKGVGAGFMLSSTLGPVGMAIGIAIDEGIRKEITTTAQNGNVDITRVFQQQWQAYHKSLSDFKKPVVRIDHFGFITWPGEGDLAVTKLHITLTDHLDRNLVVKYPEDFENDQVETVSLAQIKNDFRNIQRLFTSASTAVINQLIMGANKK